MKKLKRILVLSLVVAIIFAFGCNTPKANDEEPSQSLQETKYQPQDIKVAVLKGPTAIGMVELMNKSKEGKAENNYIFSVAASADEFTSLLIKGDIQIAAMPCNAAATLYNKSQGKIKILAINTLGVLYILENGNSIASLNDLKGKTIYSTGKGTTPEYTLRYLLKNAGIDPDNDVILEFKSEAAEVAAMLAKGEGTVAMLPQPYVTTVTNSNSNIRIAFDVPKEWKKLNKDSTVVTGVLAVNSDYYDTNKAAVDKFMEEYEASVNFVNSNVDEAAQYLEDFDIFKAAIAKKAIPKCNITFIAGSKMQEKVSEYLKVLYDQNPASVGGSLPDNNFYLK